MIKSFTVKKSKWCRGGKKGPAYLLNEKGNMCCLGFLGKACKINKKVLDGTGMPYEVERNFVGNYPKLLFQKWDTKKNALKKEIEYYGNSDKEFADVLAHINDATDIKDKKRIELLQKIFSYKGIKMKVIP